MLLHSHSLAPVMFLVRVAESHVTSSGDIWYHRTVWVSLLTRAKAVSQTCFVEY